MNLRSFPQRPLHFCQSSPTHLCKKAINMKLFFHLLCLASSALAPTSAQGLVGTARGQEHELKDGGFETIESQRKLFEAVEGTKDSPTPKVSMSFAVNEQTLQYEMDIKLTIYDGIYAPPTNLTGCIGANFSPNLTTSAENTGCQYNNGNREPNEGHLHFYVGRRSEGAGRSGPFETIGFGIQTADGLKAGNICDFVNVVQEENEIVSIVNGDELIVMIEFENNDHTRRTKNKPRDFPPIDAVTFRKIGSTINCVKPMMQS